MLSRQIAVFALVAVFGSMALVPATNAEEPKKEAPAPKKDANSYEEAILRHFKQKSDTASLIGFLKEHSASDDDLLAIPDLTKQLGSEQFALRDSASKKLLALGLPALMPLFDATNDPDAERAGRAKRIMEKMARGTETVSVPAVTIRVLIKRNPQELLETLLRYLPYTTDAEVEEEIYDGIDSLAVKDKKVDPALVKMLDDKLPARRAVAACIIARAGNAEQKKAAQKLLNDPDAAVRLRAAQGFLAGLDKTGIPTLIDLLDNKSAFIAWQAEELLVWSACGSAPQELVMSGGEMAKKAKAAWNGWWTKNEISADLTTAAKQGKGPWLLKSTDGTAIAGSDGRCRWSAPREVQQCALLNNNRFVSLAVTSRNEGIVMTEDLLFYEKELNGVTRHKVELTKCDWFLATNGRNTISANGIFSYSVSSRIFIAGIEGRFLSCEETRTRPLGATDGLTWNFESKPLVVLVTDPLTGYTVKKWKPSEHDDLKHCRHLYPFSRGRILAETGAGIWYFDFDKPRCILEFELPTEGDFSGACPIRGNRFALCWGAFFTVYSSDQRILSRSKFECSFDCKAIVQFLPLVGFGFP